MAVAYYNYVLATLEEREVLKKKRRQIRELYDPFDLPDEEFQALYRINKAMAHYLVEKLSVDLEPLAGGGIPARVKILSAVQFLVNGGYQRQLCIAQSTISKYLSQFVKSVYKRLLNEWINFPATEQSRSSVASGFLEKYGVPNVLGTIDCTHVKIFPPMGEISIPYKNVKSGYHTINVQLVADSDCRIIAVNARYPGQVHDSYIWRHSNIRTEMKRLHDSGTGNFVLLGDSSYPLEPWLMTPIINSEPGSAERRYNDWNCKVRESIERTNSYLKGSLQCIGTFRMLHYAPEKASEIIYACCVLYNIMKHFGVEMEEDDVDDNGGAEDSLDNEDQPFNLFTLAQNRRQELVNLFL